MGRDSLNYRRGRGGRPFERAKKQLFSTAAPVCARCGKPVDMFAPYRDPVTGKVNKKYRTFGHRDELDAGGDPYDGRVEHLDCNSRAGAEYRNRKHDPSRQELRSSPDWD